MLFILCLLISPCLFAKEFSIAVNERDIYRYKNEQGEWNGKDIDLVRALFVRLPHNYKITAMPWPRVLQSLKSGAVDMTLAATDLPERREYGLFSREPFRFSHYSLFVHKNKLKHFNSSHTLQDLTKQDVLIGALRGAIYSGSYHKLLDDSDFVERLVYIGNDQNMVTFALKGRVDAYIDSEIEGKHYLSRNPQFGSNIVPLFRITSEEEAKSLLLFSKKTVSQALVDEIDNALRQLHESGEYERISQKYKLAVSSN